ncbi:MAG: hypothetical protein PVF93_01745 [Chromatiaceae bacterium]|jgi:hypothetical protein
MKQAELTSANTRSKSFKKQKLIADGRPRSFIDAMNAVTRLYVDLSGVVIAALLMGLAIFTSSVVYSADDQVINASQLDWQVARLMAPTTSQRQAESKGQVFIYDSLDINEVEAAMDSNFDRIENMMFIRIHHPVDHNGGDEEIEDDGC